MKTTMRRMVVLSLAACLMLGGFAAWTLSAPSTASSACLAYTAASYDASSGSLRIRSGGSGDYFQIAGFFRGTTLVSGVGYVPLAMPFYIVAQGSSPGCSVTRDFSIGGPYGLTLYASTVWLQTGGKVVVTLPTPISI